MPLKYIIQTNSMAFCRLIFKLFYRGYKASADLVPTYLSKPSFISHTTSAIYKFMAPRYRRVPGCARFSPLSLSACPRSSVYLERVHIPPLPQLLSSSLMNPWSSLPHTSEAPLPMAHYLDLSLCNGNHNIPIPHLRVCILLHCYFIKNMKYAIPCFSTRTSIP